jgi:hypothetical protein
MLVAHSITNFRVLDSSCVTTCTTTANIVAGISELRQFTAKEFSLRARLATKI